MFITRATRHDHEDVKGLLEAHGCTDVDLSTGVTFTARDGGVVGCVRLVDLEPQTVVVDQLLVREGRRGEGIAARLMQAA
ncbi:MAG: GNAT family N-acetyltransferase [Actinomycetota bacterium]